MSVSVQQSPIATDFATDPAGAPTTAIFFLMLPDIAANQTEFMSQFANTTWNTTTQSVPSHPECIYLTWQVSVGSLTGYTVQASYEGGSIFGVRVSTAFTQISIAVAVLQVGR